MSVTAAVHLGSHVWIGSDTATNMRDEIHPNGPKWVLAPDRRSALGHAGDAAILQAMRNGTRRLAWDKKPEIMRRSLKMILDKQDWIRPYHGERDSVSNYGQSWLYAWKGGIVYIACDFSILGPEAYAAIGSGAPYALGAAFGSVDAPESTLKRMLRAAMRWNIYCGGEVWATKLAA